MSLARRFLVAFASVLALGAVAYFYVIYTFGLMAERTAGELRMAEAAEVAGHLEREVLQDLLLLGRFAETRDEALLKEIQARRVEAAANRDALRELTQLPQVAELVARFEALRSVRAAAGDRVIEAVRAGLPLPQVFELLGECARLDREVVPLPRAIVGLEHAALAESMAGTVAQRAEFVRNVTALTLLIGLVTVLISLVIARGVSRSVAPLVSMAEAIGRGDFSARTPLAGSREISAVSVAFNRMAAELQQLEKAKDEFVALASHQLRTPATAVKGNISMLLDRYFGDVSAEQEQILNDAYAANERQLELIEDMLNVARAETGRLVLVKAPIDLARLVDEVVAEHRFTVNSRGQTLELHRPDTLACEVDLQKMKIVVDNLVSNAVKYTPRGGHIDVRLEAHDGGVTLSVQDNGVGIPLEARDRLFRKFSRIDNRLSVESGGTGLGLYLANEIVKLHGGAILVDSGPDGGSTFKVRMPGGG